MGTGTARLFEALISGLLAGFFWLDRYQLFQLLVSRPIVCAPITGLILGDLGAGCSIGLMYELLWLRRPPVGGYIAPDATLASISATAIAILLLQRLPMNLLSAACLSFFATYPLTIIASRIDGLFRLVLGRIALIAETTLLEHGDRAIAPHIAAGLILGFLNAFFLVTIYVILGFHTLWRLMDFIPQDYYLFFSIGFYAVIITGISDLISGFSKSIQIRIFVLGLIVAVLLCYVFSHI